MMFVNGHRTTHTALTMNSFWVENLSNPSRKAIYFPSLLGLSCLGIATAFWLLGFHQRVSERRRGYVVFVLPTF
jgi:hypothetical protein